MHQLTDTFFNDLEILDQADNKKDLSSTYRKLAKKFHPDVGGTAEQFHALSKAYHQRLLKLESQAIKTERDSELRVDPSVSKALAELYLVVSDVEQEVKKYKDSLNISQKQLGLIFDEIKMVLRANILDKPYNEVIFASSTLGGKALEINDLINNVYKGANPVFAAMLGGAFVSIALGILALMIALNPSMIGFLSVASIGVGGLVVTPLVGGFVFGSICFFAANVAEKNRLTQQLKIKTIVAAINTLTDAIAKRSTEFADIFEENPNRESGALLTY